MNIGAVEGLISAGRGGRGGELGIVFLHLLASSRKYLASIFIHGYGYGFSLAGWSGKEGKERKSVRVCMYFLYHKIIRRRTIPYHIIP